MDVHFAWFEVACVKKLDGLRNPLIVLYMKASFTHSIFPCFICPHILNHKGNWRHVVHFCELWYLTIHKCFKYLCRVFELTSRDWSHLLMDLLMIMVSFLLYTHILKHRITSLRTLSLCCIGITRYKCGFKTVDFHLYNICHRPQAMFRKRYWRGITTWSLATLTKRQHVKRRQIKGTQKTRVILIIPSSTTYHNGIHRRPNECCQKTKEYMHPQCSGWQLQIFGIHWMPLCSSWANKQYWYAYNRKLWK